MTTASQDEFELACCTRLGNAPAYNHLMPIALHPAISRLWVVRNREITYGRIPHSRHVSVSAHTKLGTWLKILHACRRLAARAQVKAFVSFNPIPYGLIAAAAARPYHKPVHYGFIGSDWFVDFLTDRVSSRDGARGTLAENRERTGTKKMFSFCAGAEGGTGPTDCDTWSGLGKRESFPSTTGRTSRNSTGRNNMRNSFPD